MSTKKIQIIGNFGGNSIELDDTLTQIGQAADAKATGDAIEKVQASIDDVSLLIEKLDETYYTEAEIDNMIADLNTAVDGKSDSDHVHDDLYYTETEIDTKLSVMQSAIDSKVEAETGKGLSTEDYTTDEKDKLASIDDNANFYEHPTLKSHSSGLYKVTIDEFGHVSDVETVTKQDILDLQIPAQDTVYDDSELSGKIGNAENDIIEINKKLEEFFEDIEEYKESVSQNISYNDLGIKGNKEAIEAIQLDYLTSADKQTLQDDIQDVTEKAKENKDAITVLNGEGVGSIKKSINDAFDEFAANISDDKVVNTYKELIDYAADHSAEFVELVGIVRDIGIDVGELENDFLEYKEEVSEQWADFDTTFNGHITNQNNPHGVTKEQIGLSNVDNTSDLEKPISDAVREAYYDKEEIAELITVEDIDYICGSQQVPDGDSGIIPSYNIKVDSTLTQSGYAADAKAVGDALAQKSQVQIVTWEADD